MKNKNLSTPLSLVRPDLLIDFRHIESEFFKAKVRLHANENPYSIKNKYLSQNAFNVNRYPENQPILLKNKLKNLYKINEREILLTRGSDEAIDLIIRGFCTFNTDEIIVCPPTFSMYEKYANLSGIKVVKIPLLEETNFGLNVSKILERVEKYKSKIIFIPNPNAPLGHFMDQGSILELCKKINKTTLLIIDEAYLEFSNKKSFIEHLKQYPHLIILRTLSKFFGLAGLRLGCCIASEEIIQFLNYILPPYNLCLPSIQVALNALTHKNLQWRNKKNLLIQVQREKLKIEFKRFKFIKNIYPSETNFITLRVDNPEYIVKHFEKSGILVRNINSQLKDCIRISVGNVDENKKLIKSCLTALSFLEHTLIRQDQC